MPAREIERLLEILDQAFDKKSWHGTNLRGSLRGLNHVEASWRPNPERHNIWELTLHAAYWKYITRRRLSGDKRGSFPRRGSDWFPRPEGRGESEWREDVRLLVATHRELRAEVATLRAADLETKAKGSTVRHFDMIAGVAAHDLYHAGQIQLLKKLGGKGKK